MKNRITHLQLSFCILTFAAIQPCAAQDTIRTESYARALNLRNSRMIPVENRAIEIYDVVTPRTEVGQRLFKIHEHPSFDSLLTFEAEQRILSEINLRCNKLDKDTLLTSDLIWVYRPYFDWLFNEDPHCRIEPMIPAKDVRETKRLKVPEFDVLCINDTLIVNQSLDPDYQTGDRILSVNDIPVSTFLEYTYPDRYDTPANIMRHYYFSNVVDTFRIKLERGGCIINTSTAGDTQSRVVLKLKQQQALKVQTFPDAKSACITIPSFYPNNSWLIKKLHNQIKKFKAIGITNVILDLRMNPGGNGDRFDELLSIFINRPSVKYLRKAKVKCSQKTMGLYDFLTEEMLGQTVELPDNEIVREFPLQSKMYIDGMRYYVLMSRDTGSIAASFCNILQFNDAALLVGEPLLRNALKYGETVQGKILLPTLLQQTGISIVEYDEYTRAVDGVLMPDIAIPYVARDYLSGRDAVLDKLLEIIEKQNG